MPADEALPDDLGIEIEAAPEEEAVPEGEDPADREGLELLPLGKPRHDPRFLVSYSCLEHVLAHGQRHADTEVGGVLLGCIRRCPRGRVTEVTESVPALKTQAGLGHVTFSHETWEELHKNVDSLNAQRESPLLVNDSWQEIYNELETRPAKLKIVGWYHTHPGFGAFYSEQDRFIQRHFFAGQGQVGIVVDPNRMALSAFETQEEEVVELPGLLVTADRATRGDANKLLRHLSFPNAGHKGKGILGRFMNDD